METYKKKDFEVSNVRRFLEPGPVVLVSSAWQDSHDVMTMGWHTVMEFTSSLVGCIISSGNHSFDLVRNSRECVINLPTEDMLNVIAGIGTTTGSQVDKFKKFKLTVEEADYVQAPLIQECYANFECKLADDRLVDTYNYFIFEVVKAHVATSPKYPKTVHYRGNGIFMTSGGHVTKKALREM